MGMVVARMKIRFPWRWSLCLLPFVLLLVVMFIFIWCHCVLLLFFQIIDHHYHSSYHYYYAILCCLRVIILFIELDDGKIYRKAPYFMVKTMVSCRFSLKPTQWTITSLWSDPAAAAGAAAQSRRECRLRPGSCQVSWRERMGQRRNTVGCGSIIQRCTFLVVFPRFSGWVSMIKREWGHMIALKWIELSKGRLPMAKPKTQAASVVSPTLKGLTWGQLATCIQTP